MRKFELTIDEVDRAEEVRRQATARAVVFERMFELLSSNAQTGRVDFAQEREHEFWDGLRTVAIEVREGIAELAETMLEAEAPAADQEGAR